MSLAVRRVLLAFLLAVCTLEIGTRVIGPRVWHVDFGPMWQWIVYTPVLRWENRRDFKLGDYELNEHGLRGTSISIEKPPGVTRILCLGDNSTFGVARKSASDSLDDALTANYPEIVSRVLARRGRTDVEVLNAGVIGYSSSHGLRALIHRWLAFEPDIVVLRFGMNGHAWAWDHTLRVREPHSPLMRSLLYASARTGIGTLGIHGLRMIAARPEGEGILRVGDEDQFERDLRRFHEISQEEGFALVVLDYPMRSLDRGTSKVQPGVELRVMGVKSLEELHAIHDRWQARQARVVAELGVPFIDTAGPCRSENGRCFSDFDMIHPSEFGHRLIADRLVKRLTREELLARGEHAGL